MAKHRTYKKRRGGQASTYNNVSNTASVYGEKIKQGVSSGLSSVSNWFSNLGKSSTPAPTSTYTPTSAPAYAPTSAPAYAPTQPPTYVSNIGGKRRRRFKTRRNKHGGNLVRAFNTYNDSFTMNATPVFGYSSAKPLNWVGGRSRRRSRR
jgi:hypothetical protein